MRSWIFLSASSFSSLLVVRLSITPPTLFINSPAPLENIFVNTIEGSLISYGVCAPDLSHIEYTTQNYITLKPNPATEEIEINIITTESGYYTVDIYSIHGKKCFTKKLYLKNEQFKREKIKFDMNLNNFTTGVYHVVVQTPSRRITKQMSVIK